MRGRAAHGLPIRFNCHHSGGVLPPLNVLAQGMMGEVL